VVALLGVGLPQARAVCRVLGPTDESGEHEVVFDSTTQALYVIAPDQLVDYRCRAYQPDEPIRTGSTPPVPGYDFPAPVRPEPSDGLTYESPHELDLGLPDDIGAIANGSMLGFAEGGHRNLIDGGVLQPRVPICRDGAPADPVYGTLVHTVIQPAL